MTKGRVVKIWSNAGAVPSVSRSFYVAIEPADTAINAVLAAYPEYEGRTVNADEGLSSTAIAFLEMDEGEVRDRVAGSRVNLIAPAQGDGGTLQTSGSLRDMADASEPATVLVVDDVPMLRMDTVDNLDGKGSVTLEAKNAEDALRIMAERPDVRVLFTDFNMPPGPNGINLTREVHRRWPKAHLIVTSSDSGISNKDLPDDGRFIAKPYQESQPMREIDDVLEQAGEDPQ